MQKHAVSLIKHSLTYKVSLVTVGHKINTQKSVPFLYAEIPERVKITSQPLVKVKGRKSKIMLKIT